MLKEELKLIGGAGGYDSSPNGDCQHWGGHSGHGETGSFGRGGNGHHIGCAHPMGVGGGRRRLVRRPEAQQQ